MEEEELEEFEREELNPNCSEIVWKLKTPNSVKRNILKALENKKDKNQKTYMGGDFPNKFLGIMINCLKEEKKYGCNLNDIKLKMVNNDEEEDWSFIKEGFRLAKLCLNKKMGRKEAKELLKKHFDGNEEEELEEFEREELNPNCSEQVFKLTGDLNDIKKEVLNMLDVIQNDEFPPLKKEINKLRKRINNITNLKEFEDIVFEFTCNYETYFKVKKNDLLVATCNNHSWGDQVNYEYDTTDWDKIANQNYYKQIFRHEKYIISKEEYSDKPNIFIFETEEGFQIEADKSFKLIKKRNKFHIIKDNKLIEVKEIKDETLKNKLMILANL